MTAERPQGLVPGSGKRGASRSLDRVVSVRVDDPLLAEVCRLAAKDGVSPSQWMRGAIGAAVFEAGRPATFPGFRHRGWQCDHVQITAGNAVLGAASCGQGCEMLPLYELAA